MDARGIMSVSFVAMALTTFGSFQTAASDYPTRPVMLITSTPPGNGPDVIARVVAEGLSKRWKQQVLVDNRPGGRAIVATQAVIGSQPDGYTLYVALGSTFVVLPVIQPKLPFDLQRDLAPVGLVGEQPFVIAVNPKLGVNTLAELIARSREKPESILYGCARGSAPHIAMELLQERSGTKLTLVPYQAVPKAIGDTLAGTISVVVDSFSSLAGPVRSGTLKAIAVMSSKRLPDFPDVPTVAETIPGFEAYGWFALMAPAGTPQILREKVSADLRDLLAQPALTQKFATLGTYPRPLSPTEVADFIRQQRETWSPLVQKIGLLDR